jgi:hypothetical protein
VRPYRMSRAWVVRKKVNGKWTMYGCKGRLCEWDLSLLVEYATGAVRMLNRDVTHF